MHERYWQLDFFRAIAIISVFLNHNLILPSDNYFLIIINNIITILWCGVDLFFVLSGFLISTILFNANTNKNNYFRFLYKRALRIFPLYYFWLVIYFFYNLVIFSESEGLQELFPYLITYTFNFYILITNSWPEHGQLNHLWSLAVEEQFYIIWPIVFFITQKNKLIYVLLTGIMTVHTIKIIMYINNYPWEVIYTQLFTRMDAILCGALAAWLWKYKKDHKLVVLLSGLCAIISLAFIISVVVWKQSALLSNQTVTFVSIGLCWFFSSIVLLSLYISNQKLQFFLDNEFFKTIATLSYGIYISHYIIMNKITELMDSLDISNIIIEFFLNLFLTLIVSYALYKIVEKPFLNHKNSIDL